MTSLVALWLPILLSAVVVFVVSSVLHMVVQHHTSDYRQLPDETKVLDALRCLGVAPGQYMFPCAKSMKEFGSPEMKAKFERGPVGTLIVRPSGCMGMGKPLGQWFVFCVVVGVFTAYITGLGNAPGAAAMHVFRTAGAVAVLGYAFSSVTDSIWKGISWGTTARFVFDGLVYGLATGGLFAALWPAAA